VDIRELAQLANRPACIDVRRKNLNRHSPLQPGVSRIEVLRSVKEIM
jgi:hypothetical protein